jgi:hypothetical protein
MRYGVTSAACVLRATGIGEPIRFSNRAIYNGTATVVQYVVERSSMYI